MTETEVGLLFLLAACGVMLVALITNHRGKGFFIFRPGEGWEYVMTLGIVGIAIGALGAGEWSLATRSMVPSASALHSASRLERPRIGGAHL